MSTIYFHVVTDFDLQLSGGYAVENVILLRKFSVNNKKQIMIIKLLKSEFPQKQFRKELIFII